MRKILITGGVGFVGSTLVRYIISETSNAVVVVDKLTYVGSLTSLAPVAQNECFAFEKVDVCDRAELARVFTGYRPDCVMHLAAENHADRSTDGPAAFIETDTAGTYTLLEAARAYWTALTKDKESASRFHHISTDEVYGDLHSTDDSFTETTPYTPSSPYPASKASSDHLVRVWLRTHGLSMLITSCSNNYGLYHFPERLIPLMILSALTDKPLPVYGNGQQIRDWLYVEDHARTLYCVTTTRKVGGTCNIDGHNKRKNLDVAETIYELLERLAPSKLHGAMYYRNLITFAVDCPRHDLRHVTDASKIARELGQLPQETSESGMCRTMQWYLANEIWWKQVQDGSYQGERLGLKG